MKRWGVPPVVKVYEAFGALADARLKLVDVTADNVSIMAAVAEHAGEGASPTLLLASVEELVTAWLGCRVTPSGGPLAPAMTAYSIAIEATCTSSSNDKHYAVTARFTVAMDDEDPPRPTAESRGSHANALAAIKARGIQALAASNDNGSLFQAYLGYPAIALLMALGVTPVDSWATVSFTRGIHWKGLATKFKNDWDRVVQAALDEHVKASQGDEGRRAVVTAAEALHERVKEAVACLFVNKKPKVSGAKRAR